MTAVFRADRRRRPTAVFDPVEATLLRGLVAQLVELVEDGRPTVTEPVQDWAVELGLEDVGVPGPTAPPEDAVLRRLLPDGYRADGPRDADGQGVDGQAVGGQSVGGQGVDGQGVDGQGVDGRLGASSAAEFAAEFRSLTENGLRRTKSTRARLVLDSLGQPTPDRGERRSEVSTDSPRHAGTPAGGPGADGSWGAPLDADEPVTVRLEPDRAQAWLTVLTDLRLALATRLGIETEEDSAALDALAQAALARVRRRQRRVRGTRAGGGDAAAAAPDDPRIGVYQVYSWLGYLQESLVQALS